MAGLSGVGLYFKKDAMDRCLPPFCTPFVAVGPSLSERGAPGLEVSGRGKRLVCIG